MSQELTQNTMTENASTELLKMHLVQSLQMQQMTCQLLFAKQKEFLQHQIKRLRTENFVDSAAELHALTDAIGLHDPMPGVADAARQLGILRADEATKRHATSDECLPAERAAPLSSSSGERIPKENGHINGKAPSTKTHKTVSRNKAAASS